MIFTYITYTKENFFLQNKRKLLVLEWIEINLSIEILLESIRMTKFTIYQSLYLTHHSYWLAMFGSNSLEPFARFGPLAL